MGAVAGEELMQAPSGLEERILVSVRVRPLNGKEIARNDGADWECINDTTILYMNNLSVSERSMYPTAYTFDRVFSPDCSSRQVYKDGAREVALCVVRGINSSVFAYGQTSSGKTYTMSGITEYAMADIYEYIYKHKEREFVLKFSAMEIYNESVRDLLSADSTPLRLLDDPEKGTIVEKLTEETLRDWNHFKELLSICEAQRQIGETSLNETSSRSHQILRVSIESSALEFLSNDKSSMLAATVNFVDLAGSERASQSLSAGTRLKEGCHINRSLLTLGTVVRKLSKGRNGHVPFRDSKLTRILQSSLGGNSRTAIICTMSPARSHVEQSRNTLLFASCAKEVTTSAQVNVVVSDKALVKKLQKELARLESELKSSRPASTTSDLSAKLQEKDLQIEKLEKDVMELTRQRDFAQAHSEDLLQAAEHDEPSIVLGDHQYPKLRVRSSRKFDNSMLELPVYVNPRCHDGSVGSFDTSQYSDGHSSSSDDSFIQLPEFEGNFQHVNCSQQLSISVSNYDKNDQHREFWEDIEEPTYENSEDHCKEVRCVEIEESNHDTYNISESNQNIHVGSNTASPDQTTSTSGLTVVENEGTADEKIGSLKCKDNKRLNGIRPLVLESPGKPCPYLPEKDNLCSSIMKLTRSRSCEARLMSNISSCRFEKTYKNESTPPNLVEKDLSFRPQNYERKLIGLQFDVNTERLSTIASQNSVRSTTIIEHQMQDEMVDDEKKASLCNIDAGLKELQDLQDEKQLRDRLVQETEPMTTLAERNVKDVGLEPVQDDVGSPSEVKRLQKDIKDVGLDSIHDDSRRPMEWPSEFKRLQREIIELWHACNVSLVHRTFFFLLFKGEPTDSTYMKLEIRMLSSLKETYSTRNRTADDGHTLTHASSARALRQERQTLSKQMQRRLSREERENLFLKWSIKLNSNHRTLQLSRRLWTDTTDMKHITESATIVAKVVGFVQPGQAFAGVNFTPQSTTRKHSLWMRNLMKPKLMKRSMMSLL